jgi:phenylacetate-coenzyme A ligase PaaK-like adenylate-forming protein
MLALIDEMERQGRSVQCSSRSASSGRAVDPGVRETIPRAGIDAVDIYGVEVMGQCGQRCIEPRMVSGVGGSLLSEIIDAKAGKVLRRLGERAVPSLTGGVPVIRYRTVT